MVGMRGQEKRRPRFSVGLVFFLIFLSFAVCFFIYMKNGQIPEDSLSASGEIVESEQIPTPEETTAQTEALTVSETEPPEEKLVNPVPESAPKGLSYLINECNFVGDSLTVGLSSYGLLPEKNVIANVGMNVSKINTDTITTLDGDMTALEALKKNNPKNVYIMLGSNGISWLTNESMISEYGVFIDSVKEELPEAAIYIISIPPVTANKEIDTNSPILNSDIDAYNSELLKLADNKGVYFVDLNTGLKGNDGKLASERSDGDGMHFKKSTYDIMLDYLLTHTADQ